MVRAGVWPLVDKGKGAAGGGAGRQTLWSKVKLPCLLGSPQRPPGYGPVKAEAEGGGRALPVSFALSVHPAGEPNREAGGAEWLPLAHVRACGQALPAIPAVIGLALLSSFPRARARKHKLPQP